MFGLDIVKNAFRKLFPDNSPVFKFIFKIYRYKYWYPKICKFDLLKAYSSSRDYINFIQIGSNNGIIGDPLYPYIIKNKWTGVLVEPVPYLFEELKVNYLEVVGRLQFENSAIASESGQLTFYRLQKTEIPGMPIWYDQLGSFKKEVILRHKDVIPNFDELLLEDKVAAITFVQLLEKYDIQKLNLIHIDTEGYDFEILKLIPYASFEIEFIMFEHVHLISEEYKKALVLLKKNGYTSRRYNTDTIAIKKGLMSLLKIQTYY